MADRHLSLREAAKTLGLSEVWVRRLASSGRFRTTHDGRRIVVAESELARFQTESDLRRAARKMAPGGEEDWASEKNVVAALVAHLAAEGWTILSQADPATQEHGVDLLVERAGVRRAIEAKGFPSAVYARGDRAGERKRWRHPAARSYMGDLLLEVFLLPGNEPDSQIAMALPVKATFVTLIQRLKPLFERLGIGVYVVHPDGRVDTVLEAREPRW